MARARYRGLDRVTIQVLMTFMVMNGQEDGEGDGVTGPKSRAAARPNNHILGIVQA